MKSVYSHPVRPGPRRNGERPYQPQKVCEDCCGLSWRRQKPGCKGCGEPFVAEAKPQAVDFLEARWTPVYPAW